MEKRVGRGKAHAASVIRVYLQLQAKEDLKESEKSKFQ